MEQGFPCTLLAVAPSTRDSGQEGGGESERKQNRDKERNEEGDRSQDENKNNKTTVMINRPTPLRVFGRIKFRPETALFIILTVVCAEKGKVVAFVALL